MTEDPEEPPTTWETYEQVARYLLEKMGDTLGLGLESVEGKQKLVGKSGMEWEIEGKGVKADRAGQAEAPSSAASAARRACRA
jgi:hypothetical protein